MLIAQQPSTESGGSVIVDSSNGAIRATVTDTDGAVVPGAAVTLMLSVLHADSPTTTLTRMLTTGSDGSFVFPNIPPGTFELSVTPPEYLHGFSPGTASGTLRPGQVLDLPAIVLHSADATASITVVPLTQYQLAEQEVKAEEQQRVFHIIPNFFVTYKKNPAPLAARQKFELAFHGTYDAASFISSAFVAGIEQANDTLPGYHQGMVGYGKRFGATYANFASATILRDAFFPTIFHQDPRYHFKGTGSFTSRAIYALSSAVICYGDNGRREFNYSSLLGNLSAGALTNVYYPKGSRNGVSTTFGNGLLATAGVGVGHLIQEFVFVRITNKAKKTGTYDPN